MRRSFLFPIVGPHASAVPVDPLVTWQKLGNQAWSNARDGRTGFVPTATVALHIFVTWNNQPASLAEDDSPSAVLGEKGEVALPSVFGVPGESGKEASMDHRDPGPSVRKAVES